ncbi:16S rRNA (uracil(1498)-N(3))-methyltransferase [Psychrobacter sp. HD31]|uniref:16S rRNA (uracil(1498)-N(3))-methyltransferase n=1 Tax=Psychrobacter sp. HD31 TaxID=3112003 RepID=UPI003DA60C64
MNILLLPPKTIENNQAIITDIMQCQHVKQVLKSNVGDVIKVGQLGGKIGTANVSQITDTNIVLNNVKLTQPPPSKLNLTVILALPRPKVLRRLIMDMTAMGVKHIILVNSYKTQKSYWQSPMLNRLDEFVLEGLQQGVDTIPPKIELKKRFKPFVEDDLAGLMKHSDNSSDVAGLVAHPYTNNSWYDFFNKAIKQDTGLPPVLWIGAEGGWIDYEVALLKQHGCLPVSLGQRILRTEAVVNNMVGFWGMV